MKFTQAITSRNICLLEGVYKRVKISPFDPNGNWIVQKDFTYYVGYKGSNEEINIPKGFIFNGVSIPQIFFLIATPMDSDTIIAALVHDWLFNTRQYSLQKTDEIFYEVMEECGVNNIKRILLFLGLRIGSWYVWNKIGQRIKNR